MKDAFRPLTPTAAAAAVAGVATVAYAANPQVGGAPMYTNKNIVENAVNSKDHTTLVAAVKAAGLAGTLQGEGPFTVFAPTNEAFAALPAGTVDALLQPNMKKTLQTVLTCHVVSAKAMSSAIEGMIADDGGKHVVPTVGGCNLIAWEKDGIIMLEDENGNVASVTQPDVEQSNGVIHVIDTVLLPKS